MNDTGKRYTGGCLCGALRYEAEGEPLYTGYCYCGDCRKASGSGFIPFLGFSSRAVRFTGEPRQFWSKNYKGKDAVRNFCPTCGGLVFGGEVGVDDSHTVYAGTLDTPALFQPAMAIFLRDRAPWAPLPPGLEHCDTMPE
ncbi:GFA family protein [Melittangium boletus]|uniref:GFA family protein n=1 Tax=Melittangium boletus TaxID=83453 RepID=UPI003DA6BB46